MESTGSWPRNMSVLTRVTLPVATSFTNASTFAPLVSFPETLPLDENTTRLPSEVMTGFNEKPFTNPPVAVPRDPRADLVDDVAHEHVRSRVGIGGVVDVRAADERHVPTVEGQRRRITAAAAPVRIRDLRPADPDDRTGGEVLEVDVVADVLIAVHEVGVRRVRHVLAVAADGDVRDPPVGLEAHDDADELDRPRGPIEDVRIGVEVLVGAREIVRFGDEGHVPAVVGDARRVARGPRPPRRRS